MSENIRFKSENNEKVDSSEMTQEECDLYDLFINEYNDLFENVLNLKGKNLYSIIKHNVSLLIGNSNFNKYSRASLKKIHNKLKEDYFEPDSIVIKYLEENLDSINTKTLPILNIDTIFAHCNKCYETTHICGEPLYNYKYYDLIICLKCKTIYKKNMIRLFCNSCQEEYYSYIVNESNYKNDFFPATWEKYHCFSFNYDQMPCPECAAPLYYSELKSLLKCFKCNWTSNPNKVLWECEICGQKFSSKIKEFVKYEIKPEINCVKYALINHINARPYQCKCCGENPVSINFFHPNCGGGYYLSYLQNKFTVVCNKCKIIQDPEKVKWGCGNCKKSFLCDKMIVLESAIGKEKNFGMPLGLRNNNKKGYFVEKKYGKFKTDAKDKFLTSKKTNKGKNEGIKKIQSQKIEFKPKTKTILERNKDNLNLSIRRNFDNNLQTLDINENRCKNNFEKISKNFFNKKDGNFSFPALDLYSLQKNRSENKINFKSYNQRKLGFNNNITYQIAYNKNINEKEKNNKNLSKLMTEKRQEDKYNRIKKIKTESSKFIKVTELKPIKERNSKRIKADNYPSSAIEQIQYTESRYKLRNSNNPNFKYNRLKANTALERTSIKGQSQKKTKNIRFNFNLNININNILDNNKYNNNTIYSIKPEKPLEPPEIFKPDEFKLVEKIGFGSFGKIYKVRWIRNNENYAMKIINIKHFDDIDDTQKKLKIMRDFCKETNSQGIIKTYGNLYEKIGREDYKYYILMELAQTDWEQEIKKRDKKQLFYTQPELFDIIKQLVSCYALLQKNNISHRDVKPQNVLILNGLYKLCDFGEARNISGKNGYIHQPIRGSELYMSPILFDALNNNQIDVLHNSYKSDVFSLGMCIFLAATLSFDSLYEVREEKDMKIIKKILVKYLVPRYSKNLVDILYNMLEIDEDLRPNFIELEKIIFYK